MIPDIPRGLRSKKPYESERHLLGWILKRLQANARRELSFEDISEEDQVQLETALAVIRAMVAYGRAIYLLSGSKVPETAYPLVRSLLEQWADLKFILEPGTSPTRAMESRLWGILVLLNQNAEPAPEVVSVATAIKERLPEFYGTMEKRYKAHPTGHHSGKGWRRLIIDMCGAQYGRYYQFLSWDAHPLMTGAGGSYEERDGTIHRRFEHWRAPEQAAIDVSLFAITPLTDAWKQSLASFGERGRPQSHTPRNRKSASRLRRLTR